MTAYDDAKSSANAFFSRSVPPQARPEEVNGVIQDLTDALKGELDTLREDHETLETTVQGLSTAGITDGDKGDIVVSGGGAVWTVDSSVLASYLTTSAAALAYQPLDADLTSWAGVTRAAGFDTFAATPTSANLRTLLSDESGSGALLFAGGALGTPASGTLTNCTGLPTGGILDNAVTNAKLANVAANTVKGSIAGGAPADLNPEQFRSAMRINHGPQCSPLVNVLTDVWGGPSGITAQNTTAAMVTNRWYFTRLCNERDITLTRLAIRVTTAGAAGSTCRLAIYGSLPNGLPGALLVDTGTLATDAVAFVEATISQALEAGRDYWLAAWFSGTPTVVSVNAAQAGAAIGWAIPAVAANSGYSAMIINGKTYGSAWPSDVTGEAWALSGVNVPFVAWR